MKGGGDGRRGGVVGRGRGRGGPVAFISGKHQQRIAVARSAAKVEASEECSHFIHSCSAAAAASTMALCHFDHGWLFFSFFFFQRQSLWKSSLLPWKEQGAETPAWLAVIDWSFLAEVNSATHIIGCFGGICRVTDTNKMFKSSSESLGLRFFSFFGTACFVTDTKLYNLPLLVVKIIVVIPQCFPSRDTKIGATVIMYIIRTF